MSRNGFTLLEMLVALAVFSIAALALLRLDAVAVATATDLKAREGAMLVAENEAARIATDPAAPPLGNASRRIGNGGQTFLVGQSVSPTPDQRLLRVDLAVRSADAPAAVRLTFIRRAR
ncbi:type II secretion system minor pseudopilin GspI [Sphingomonas glaciei]|uniref:Type II secretion system protein I n=1 Tax=Sphingomonas glaciei TaxID=2938948 RepID=A0ABY5MZ74_9SPHN|nr:type II secretion system minor pseudopilin GspI [Sphingomonas glaciei]UUR08373.1 type II secretion system minor pseudopilin GspI [Sphingomonas glaciei]